MQVSPEEHQGQTELTIQMIFNKIFSFSDSAEEEVRDAEASGEDLAGQGPRYFPAFLQGGG